MTSPTRPAPRGLLSNTAASAVATGWVALLTLVAVPVLIRLLGVREYGIWVLITVLAVQGRGLGSLLDLGLGQSLIQRVASTDDARTVRSHVGAGGALLGLVGTVSAVVIAVLAPALVDLFGVGPAVRADTVLAVRLIALQLAFEVPGVAFGAALEGLRRYEVRRSIDAARATVFFAAGIGVAAAGAGVVGLAAVSLASTVASTLALLGALAWFGAAPGRGGSMRREAAAGLPLLALRATGVGYRQVDRVVLGLVVGVVAVTGFDVADKVNLAALTVLGAATSALIPAAAHGLRTDRARTEGLVLRATRWSALVTLPCAAFAFGVAAPLGRMIAGTPIPGTTAAIRWLALSTIVSVVYAAAFEMAIGAAAARRLVAVSVGGLVLNLGATVVLARRYGLAGSAAATCLAAVAVTPIVARICAGVFRHRSSVLVRACVPAFALGAAVAGLGAAVTAVRDDATGVAAAAGLCGLLTAVVLLYVHRTERAHPVGPDPMVVTA